VVVVTVVGVVEMAPPVQLTPEVEVEVEAIIIALVQAPMAAPV
jgi:hypothetical protein